MVVWWPLALCGGEETPVESSTGTKLSRVTLQENGRQLTVAGNILVEAQDGGLLLLDRAGRLWNITPDKLRQRTPTDLSFTPLSSRELGKTLQQEFGKEYRITFTRHYVLCSKAGRYYTRWCGTVLERVLSAFLKQWSGERLKQHEPAFPLVAVIFADEKEFAAYATRDAGPGLATAVGYYSVRTNRIVLRDLTAGAGNPAPRSMTEVTRRLARVPFNVATVVHEATHQAAFNCGLQRRYADNPLWLTEGLAMYFETPDLRNPKGWRAVGKVNPFRLQPFRDFLTQRRKADSLRTLLQDGRRFREKQTAADAYAEAWALFYFLMKTRRPQLERYLQRLSQKKPLRWSSPEQRLQEFRDIFGDPAQLDAEFVRFFTRRRLR